MKNGNDTNEIIISLKNNDFVGSAEWISSENTGERKKWNNKKNE